MVMVTVLSGYTGLVLVRVIGVIPLKKISSSTQLNTT